MRRSLAAAALFPFVAAAGDPDAPSGPPAGGTIAVEMKPCEVERPARAVSTRLVDLLASSPDRREKLVRSGTIAAEGETFRIYLPASKAYSVRSTGTGSSDMDNTSTLVSIDADGDGKLADDESWYADLPVRLGDRMYEITGIAADGSRVDLRPSEAPLRGAVAGRKCPPFSYVATDGRKVSLEDYRGKALLLDVWSVY